MARVDAIQEDGQLFIQVEFQSRYIYVHLETLDGVLTCKECKRSYC